MMFSALAFAALVTGSVQTEGALVVVEQQPIAPAVITNPSWRTPPEVTEADYPIFAAHLGMSGRVEVECVISTEGVPDCKATKADPAGLGFEAAAVGIVERGRLNPRLVDGVPFEANMKVGVPFIPEPVDPPPAIWIGPSPSNAHLLAGMVAAQSLGRNATSGNSIDWGLHQLQPERAAKVQEWISEMYIGRTSAKLLAEGIAMVLAKRGETAVPAQPPADWDNWVREMDEAVASIYSPETNFEPLRTRYCATYDCGSSFVVR